VAEPTTDMTAVALGVAIDASDEHGAPRLIRAVVPRSSALGMTPEQAAREHLSVLAPLWISHRRAADLTSHSVQRLRNGASIVRLQQQVDSVDIHQGELRVMLRPDGALAAVAGTLRPSAGSPRFQSTAAAAVGRALDTLAGAARPHPAITEAGAKAGYQQVTVAPAPELRVVSARAKRELLPQDGVLLPIWSVELMAELTGLDGKVEPAARRYLLADADGRVLRDVNLTANDSFVYRAFADTTGNRNPLDGALDSYTPHPAGIPDNSMPGLASYNLVVMEAFNGPRDPWLGPAATTTSGNNVDAFADIAAPAGFGTGDIRPEVRAGRTLNYRYDFTAEPLATPAQSMAAAVNVFFVTNWLHDWYYDSGFTEATGNAQLDNYGRGGIGGDPLIAHAQSEALAGTRNNAQMTTLDDGASPIMDMFLWSGGPVTSLTTPTATPTTAAFVSGPGNFDVTGELVLAQNASGTGHDGCGGITDSVRGKLVLVKFTGSCSTREVVNNVAFRGAIGIVMMIAIPGEVAAPLTGSESANLPGLVVGYTDGLALEAEVPATVAMHRETKIANDGDFDNAIVAHEWGHYMHLRLTSCEAFQCFAMSEGWGDFMALHMMLRETDDRSGTFGMGLYALAAGGISAFNIDPGYFGIRRFPYSIDRARNALSFRHIGPDAALPETPINPGPVFAGNSEVHNAGEIWATMMWEAYNVLIDEHGYAEARRRMSDYAVGGMLLTPPDATYTEARDAMLAAAGALDSDDMLLIAAAFAGRGAELRRIAGSHRAVLHRRRRERYARGAHPDHGTHAHRRRHVLRSRWPPRSGRDRDAAHHRRQQRDRRGGARRGEGDDRGTRRHPRRAGHDRQPRGAVAGRHPDPGPGVDVGTDQDQPRHRGGDRWRRRLQHEPPRALASPHHGSRRIGYGDRHRRLRDAQPGVDPDGEPRAVEPYHRQHGQPRAVRAGLGVPGRRTAGVSGAAGEHGAAVRRHPAARLCIRRITRRPALLRWRRDRAVQRRRCDLARRHRGRRRPRLSGHAHVHQPAPRPRRVLGDEPGLSAATAAGARLRHPARRPGGPAPVPDRDRHLLHRHRLGAR
jgi:hypothetical protein